MLTLRYFRKNWKFMLIQLIALTVILSLAISGCAIAKKNNLGPWNPDNKRKEPVSEKDNVAATETIGATEEIATETIAVTEPPVLIDVDLPDGYEHVTEEVRILAHANLRSKPSSNKNDIIAIVEMYELATRVGVGENGWSAIITEDGTFGYLASYYLEPTIDPTYIEVNEIVYATKDANIRSGHSILCDSIGDMAKHDAFVRTAIGSSGWSKIIYNGEEAYVYSLYLTTDEPNGGLVDNAHYEEVNEIVRTTTKVNMRTGPGSSYIVVDKLSGGEEVTRVGIGDNGWSKILYNGNVYYVISKYINAK